MIKKIMCDRDCKECLINAIKEASLSDTPIKELMFIGYSDYTTAQFCDELIKEFEIQRITIGKSRYPQGMPKDYAILGRLHGQ